LTTAPLNQPRYLATYITVHATSFVADESLRNGLTLAKKKVKYKPVKALHRFQKCWFTAIDKPEVKTSKSEHTCVGF